MSTVIDEIGNTHGIWRVVARAKSARTGTANPAVWLCVCPIGHHRRITGQRLRRGSLTACPDCRDGNPAVPLDELPLEPPPSEAADRPSPQEIKRVKQQANDDAFAATIEAYGVDEYLHQIVTLDAADEKALRRYATRRGTPTATHERIMRFLWQATTRYSD